MKSNKAPPKAGDTAFLAGRPVGIVDIHGELARVRLEKGGWASVPVAMLQQNYSKSVANCPKV